MSKYRPYFHAKIYKYIEYVNQGLIIPTTFAEGKTIYNKEVADLITLGHQVIFCSYNGGFDTSALGRTARLLNIEKYLDIKLKLFCIWEFWSRNCPRHYTAKRTKSGKYFSTSAEDVYKFEFNDPNFIEEHIAFKDVEIEIAIAKKVLARDKRPPLVNTLKELRKFIPEISHKRINHVPT